MGMNKIVVHCGLIFLVLLATGCFADPTPDVSFVIKAQSSPLIYIKQSLMSIQRALQHRNGEKALNVEVLVALSSTSRYDALDSLIATLKTQDDSVPITLLEPNSTETVVTILNKAASLARAPYLLFLDETVELLTIESVHSMLNAFTDQQDSLGQLGCKVISSDDRSVHRAGIEFVMAHNPSKSRFSSLVWSNTASDEAEEPEDVPIIFHRYEGYSAMDTRTLVAGDVPAVSSAVDPKLIWAVILLPFRQKYYPLNSKTLLVFLTFIGIIILAALRVAVYPVDFRGYQAVYTSLGFQFIVFAGDTMVALVFSVVVVAWLEISLWRSKKRVSRILRICCLVLNLALLICLFVTVIIDSADPTVGAVSAGNIILAVFLLIIVIGFMVAGGRLLHLMKKIKDSKTERNGKDKVLKKKIAIVLTVIGVIGFYAVAANIISNLLPLNADINMGIEFSLRFAENIALWIMLWFFTDSIVHHIDSSRGSISSGKAKSAMSSRKVNTSTGVVAGTSTLPSQGEIENHKSSTDNEE